MTHEIAQRVSASVANDEVDMLNLFESTQIASVFLDGSMRLRTFTPAAAEILDLSEQDYGRPIVEICHSLEDADVVTGIENVVNRGRPIESTVWLPTRSAFYLMRITPYRTADARIDGCVITFIDVTVVVQARNQERLLVAELNHRVRNMLQVVVGLANQTLHRSHDLKQFEESFFGRMQALARAYDLLSRDGWHHVPVHELLETQLSPFMTEGSRYSGEGDEVVLASNAALSLGLILYELATNATKYGALSVPAGHVRVEWRNAVRADGENEFILRWQESGGPAVKPPTRHGFGSELVKRQLKYELNGTATMDFAADGLTVTLVIPAQDALEPDSTGEEQ